MQNVLRKYKLIDQCTLALDTTKSDFVNRLQSHVDPSDLGYFSDVFEVFSSSKNEYKGQVDDQGFKLKRRRRFFDSKMNMAIATGRFRQASDTLMIEMEISGFNTGLKLFYIMISIFYVLFLLGFLVSVGTDDAPLFLAPFILLHAAFMFGIPFLIMRRSVKRLKYDLEREFHFIATKTTLAPIRF
ncbi:hypothetical protein ACU8DI_05460 [Psychroserpens sp. BH13MA-6]